MQILLHKIVLIIDPITVLDTLNNLLCYFIIQKRWY